MIWMHHAEGSLASRVIADYRVWMINPPKERSRLVDSEAEVQFAEDYLAKHPWFGGDEFSAADIMMVFPLNFAMQLNIVDKTQFPKINAWKAKIEQRPAYQRMLAKARPDGMIGSPPAAAAARPVRPAPPRRCCRPRRRSSSKAGAARRGPVADVPARARSARMRLLLLPPRCLSLPAVACSGAQGRGRAVQARACRRHRTGPRQACLVLGALRRARGRRIRLLPQGRPPAQGRPAGHRRRLGREHRARRRRQALRRTHGRSANSSAISSAAPIIDSTERQVLDWAFLRGEELIGHYTTRVMLPRMDAEQAEGLRSMFGENPK